MNMSSSLNADSCSYSELLTDIWTLHLYLYGKTAVKEHLFQTGASPLCTASKQLF